jgi:hypothetical protein
MLRGGLSSKHEIYAPLLDTGHPMLILTHAQHSIRVCTHDSAQPRVYIGRFRSP